MGAWIEMMIDEENKKELKVAPFMGAWIEIVWICPYSSDQRSHLLWVRGLKYSYKQSMGARYYVAPFMGAWIEICYPSHCALLEKVAPFMGAWIEIPKYNQLFLFYRVAPFMGAWIEMADSDANLRRIMSHLLWVRGLK